jgi:hypothetical protein
MQTPKLSKDTIMPYTIRGAGVNHMEDHRDNIPGGSAGGFRPKSSVRRDGRRGFYLGLAQEDSWILKDEPLFITLKTTDGILRPKQGKPQQHTSHESKVGFFFDYGCPKGPRT